MGPLRLGLSLAILVGLASVPRAARAAAAGDEVQANLAALQDRTLANEKRATARNALINVFWRSGVPVGQEVLKAGKAATDDNVRMHVAIVLAQTREPLGGAEQASRTCIVPPEVMAPAIELLSGWFTRKDADAALRHWAAVALANTMDEKLIPLLKEKALAPGNDGVLRVSVARALANWRGEAGVKVAAPILVELLGDKDEDMRATACDCLRVAGEDDEAVIDALLKVAKEDPKEPVWRSAVATLRRLGGGQLIIKPGADDKERQQVIGNWEKVWRSKPKKPRPATK
jgi:HEAT repeat protein